MLLITAPATTVQAELPSVPHYSLEPTQNPPTQRPPIPAPDSIAAQSTDAFQQVFGDQQVSFVSWSPTSGILTAEVIWNMLGLFSQTELRAEMHRVFIVANKLREQYGDVKGFKITVKSPLVLNKDQYGNIIKGQPTTGLIVLLSISSSELAKFPPDFEWSLYSVYAAHRFIDHNSRGIHLIAKDWYAELHDETEMGRFPPLSPF